MGDLTALVDACPQLTGVAYTLGLAVVAEQAIRDWQARMPLMAEVIDGAFALVKPTLPLLGKGDLLFRAHCDELIERLIAGEDTRPGTDAEMMAALADLSGISPLIHDAAALYCRLYRRRFGGLPAVPGTASDDETYALHETWAGAMDVIEREFQRKLAQPERQNGGRR